MQRSPTLDGRTPPYVLHEGHRNSRSRRGQKMKNLRDPHAARPADARENATVPRRRPRFDQLVVATIGDAESAGALRVAVELARREGASVTAIAVTTPFSPAVHAALAPSPLAID